MKTNYPKYYKRVSPEDMEIIEKDAKELDIIFKNFNKEKCANCRRRDWGCHKKHSYRGKVLNNGCCVTCAANEGWFQTFSYTGSGYYKELFRSGEQGKNLKRMFGFSKIWGFFDPEAKRCKLPCQLRSATCNRYCCDSRLEKLSQPVAKNIQLIKDKYSILT